MQRTIEHQSWVEALGAKKCAAIEVKVDDFLAKHPTPDEYDCGDRILFPKEGATKGDRHWAWHQDIRDLVKDEDGGIYALRYACNEWELVENPSFMDYVNHYIMKIRDSVGKYIPAVKRKDAKSFADFTF